MHDDNGPLDDDPTSAGIGFRHLLEQLGAAAATVGANGREHGDGSDADGYRHILRLVSAAIDLNVERADPTRPLFTTWMTETRKFLGDNPDTIYTTAPVHDGSEYVVRVKPGNSIYVGLVVYGRDENGWRIVSSVKDSDLTPGRDGSFEVRLSPERPGGDGNWMATDPTAHWVMVREYFADHDDRLSSTLDIEVVGGSAGDGGLDAIEFARRVESMGAWIATQVAADAFLASIQRGHPNAAPEFTGVEFPPDLVATFLPTPDIAYQGCAFDLSDSESLVIRGVTPEARYWGLQVMNHWLESTDARSARNCFGVDARPGEPFELVLAEDDPGHPGWIPLHGRHSGLLAFRALLPVGEVSPLSYEVRSGGES